jgi:hypothetical protein
MGGSIRGRDGYIPLFGHRLLEGSSIGGRDGYVPLFGHRPLEGSSLSDETKDLGRKARYNVSMSDMIHEYGARAGV